MGQSGSGTSFLSRVNNLPAIPAPDTDGTPAPTDASELAAAAEKVTQAVAEVSLESK
jgi:hypothetical protein